MTTKGQAAFSIKGWDEKTWDGKLHTDVTGAKLTHALVEYTYKDAIEGESKIQYLMGYCGDGTVGSYVALEQVTGTVGGKKGTFVLQHNGTFDKTSVSGTASIVPDSGTGELAGIQGKASYNLEGHQESYPLNFEYEFKS